jgi:hypothetical protein
MVSITPETQTLGCRSCRSCRSAFSKKKPRIFFICNLLMRFNLLICKILIYFLQSNVFPRLRALRGETPFLNSAPLNQKSKI